MGVTEETKVENQKDTKKIKGKEKYENRFQRIRNPEEVKIPNNSILCEVVTLKQRSAVILPKSVVDSDDGEGSILRIVKINSDPQMTNFKELSKGDYILSFKNIPGGRKNIPDTFMELKGKKYLLYNINVIAMAVSGENLDTRLESY